MSRLHIGGWVIAILLSSAPAVAATSVDSHFHVISPANWEQSRLATQGLIDGPIDGDAAIRLLDAAGVDKAVVISSGYLIGDTVAARAENDFVASLVETHPDRFYGLCSVSVHHEGALEEVDRCMKELDLSGLKLHLFADAISLTDPEGVALVDSFFKRVASAKQGAPVLIDFNWMDDSQTIAMIQLVMANPETTVVLAHGLGHHFAELINVKIFRNALGMDVENLHLDISATLLNYPPDSPPFPNYIWHLRMLGADRVLLGSDYPAVTPKDTVEAFLKMGWSPEEQQLIQGGNAMMVFGNLSR